MIKQGAFIMYIRQYSSMMMVLLSAAIAIAAYSQPIDYPFISDDTAYVSENSRLFELHLPDLWRLFAEPYSDMSEFLPLRDLSYWIDLTLFGLNPAAFRLHNIILYLLCLPLVYGATLALWRYFRPLDQASASWAAAVVTSLFALHPAFVESVVWISGRKYVLANLFAMLALWFAVNARREYGLAVPHAVATLIALVAMMLSKASYVAVAPIIAVLWFLFWLDVDKPKRQWSVLLWPLTVLFAAILLLSIFVTTSGGEKPEPYFGVESITRPLAILGWLGRLSISPESRHYFYPVFEDPYFYVMVAGGAALIVISAIFFVMLLRKRSLEGFALLAFLLLCLPYVQLIPYISPSLVQDRYLALAAWPAMLLVVSLAWHLKRVPRIILFLIIALLWNFQVLQRSRDWSSFEALVEADFRAFPDSSMPGMYTTDIQLIQGLTLEAEETARGIQLPEVRNNMLKLVKAHQAVTFSISAGNSQLAIDSLLDFGLDLKQLPSQALWNTPLVLIWQANRNYLDYEWQRLVRHFPNEDAVRFNAYQSRLMLSKIQASKKIY